MYQICSITVCHQKKSLIEKRWTLIECRVIFDVEKTCRSAFPMHDIGKIFEGETVLLMCHIGGCILVYLFILQP